MKKILIDLLKLSNLNCGLGQVAFNYGKNLAKANTEFELHFLVPREFENQFGSENIIYHTKSGLKKYLKKNKFDLWHCIHQDPDIMPEAGTKILMTIHDLNFLGEKSERKSRKRLQELQKRVDKCSDFAFISAFSKNVACSNLNFDAKKTDITYNGVITVEKETNPLKFSGEFFFSIGVLKPKKNFHSLIPVMKFFPEIKLVIAGDKSGSYYKELVKTANREGVAKQVVFVGTISEEEKTWLYRNCKAFLFPSLYEGFGLPVIEAMRNGAPAIISNSSSLPEIGGEHAFYFNSYLPESMFEVIEDSLDKFSKNPELRNSQISYANNFTWKKNVECYLNLYKEILAII